MLAVPLRGVRLDLGLARTRARAPGSLAAPRVSSKSTGREYERDGGLGRDQLAANLAERGLGARGTRRPRPGRTDFPPRSTISARAPRPTTAPRVRPVARDRVERVGDGEDRARRAGSRRRRARPGSRARPSARGASARPRGPRRCEERDARRASARRAPCASRISRARRRLSGPGFRRIASGIPILPTSCSRNPYSRLASSASPGATRRRARPRSAARAASAARVPCPSTRARVASADDGLLVRLLEQLALPALDLDQVAEVARVQQQLLLARPRAWPRGTGTPLKPAREPLDDREQLERAERLQHERVGAAASRPRRRRPCPSRSAGRRGCRASPGRP